MRLERWPECPGSMAGLCVGYPEAKGTEVTRERKTSKPITNVPSTGVGPESRAMTAMSELEGKEGETCSFDHI